MLTRLNSEDKTLNTIAIASMTVGGNGCIKVLQSWTKAVETLPEKTCFLKSLILTFRPFSPFQCCNQVKVSTERIATL